MASYTENIREGTSMITCDECGELVTNERQHERLHDPLRVQVEALTRSLVESGEMTTRAQRQLLKMLDAPKRQVGREELP